jgi:hypothetical protein
MIEGIGDFLLTSMKQKELPATQLHQWVFSKQHYKRQTAGTIWAVFAAGLKRQVVMRRGNVHAPSRIFCFQTVHSK